MSTQWARLGAALRTARTERGLRQEDIAAQLGIKRGAVANIESGKVKRLTPTIHSYARLVGWAEGSADQVLAGADPEPAAATNQPPGAPTDPLSDPAEREIWAMQYVPEAEKVELIAAYRARRVTAELRLELEACQQQVAELENELGYSPNAHRDAG